MGICGGTLHLHGSKYVSGGMPKTRCCVLENAFVVAVMASKDVHQWELGWDSLKDQSGLGGTSCRKGVCGGQWEVLQLGTTLAAHIA